MPTLEQIGERWLAAFNKKNLDALMALYADRCVNAQPHHAAPLTGKAAIAEDLGGFLVAFPDGVMKAEHMVVDGDTMAMEWTFTGTHRGPLAGATGTIPPTGRHVRITGAEFTRHDAQGLIEDERGYFDLMSFMTQLGVVQAPV